MKKSQRMLALAGMTLAAFSTVGMAATAASAAPGQDSSTTVTQPDHGPGDHGSGNGGHDDHGNGNGNGGHDDHGNGNGGHDGHGNGGWDDHGNGGWGNGGWGNGWGNGGWHNSGWGHDHTQYAGTFRSRMACEWAGRIGERNNFWDDYSCDRHGHGHTYILMVSNQGGHWHHGGGH